MNGVRIKICGVTRVDDAAVAARADVDAVGFVLWPGSPRAVSLDQAARLGQALPPWTVRVGVFVSVSVDAVAAAVAAAGRTRKADHASGAGASRLRAKDGRFSTRSSQRATCA